MIWIKDKDRSEGKTLVVGDNLVFNPTEEQMRAEGWVPESEIIQTEQNQEPDPDEELRIRVQEVLQECQEYYADVILKYETSQGVRWVDLEERIKLKSVLEDIKGHVDSWYYRGASYKPEDALEALHAIGLYEYRCQKTLDLHNRNITVSKDPESYDYTTGYPKRLHIS